MARYVECEIPYPVDPSQVVVSFSNEQTGNELRICIPRHPTRSFSLHIYCTVSFQSVIGCCMIPK